MKAFPPNYKLLIARCQGAELRGIVRTIFCEIPARYGVISVFRRDHNRTRRCC